MAAAAALLVGCAVDSASDAQWSVGAPEPLVRGASIYGAHGVALTPSGDLAVASVAGAEVVVLDPDGGILKRIGAEASLQGPDDIAFGPDGALYATNFLTGTITRVSADGSGAIVGEVGPGVNPVTVSDDGRVFVARCFLGDGLYEIDPSGEAAPRTIVESFGGGCGLNGFDIGADGALYGPRFVTPEVVRVDVDTGAVQVVADGFSVPNGVKFDPEGAMTVLDTGAGTITRVELSTGERTLLATNLFGFDSHAFDADGSIYATSITEGQVFEVGIDGPIRAINADGGMTQPGGVVVIDGDGGPMLVVADWDVVRLFDPQTGDARGAYHSVIGRPGLSGSTTVASAPGGLVFTSYLENAVKLWDPRTQELRMERYDVAVPTNAIAYNGGVAVAELGTGEITWLDWADAEGRRTLATGLQVPTGLVSDGERLWASDWALGTLMLIADHGGALTEPRVLTADLVHPEGLALAPDGRILVVEAVAPSAGQLRAVDPTDGSTEVLAEELQLGREGPAGAAPYGAFNGVTVGSDGSVYITGDIDNAVYRLVPR